MTRFGAMVRRIDERQPGSDLPLLSVSQTRGVLRRTELTDKPPRAESLDDYKVCRQGDIIFNKMSIRAGAIGIASEDGLVTYHYEVMRPHTSADARYLVYLLKSNWFIGELVRRERGIGAGDQVGVRTTEVPFRVLRTVEAHLPEPTRQTDVADYLDRETAQIDALITKQELLIATLRERQLAVAQSTVDPPQFADSTKLKHCVLSVRQGWSPQCYNWAADGVQSWAVLKSGATNLGRFRPQENKALPPEELPRPEAVVRAGQIVVSRASTRDLVGSAAVVHGSYPRLMLSDKLYALELDEAKAIPDYVALILGTRAWRDLIELEATGSSSSMQNISQADILNLPMRLPSILEQSRRLKIVAGKSAKIDALIIKAEKFITLTRERRSALITAAVTGQIDVREAS